MPHLAQIPDSREFLKTQHRWQDLLLICLMAVGAGRHNIPAISQWLKDHRAFLLNQVSVPAWASGSYRPRPPSTVASSPSQSSSTPSSPPCLTGPRRYGRPCLPLAEQARQGSVPTGDRPVAADGKHLRGTRRIRQGEEALVFLSALV
nr:transposase family protein [Meiothermus sp. CFH 77666]